MILNHSLHIGALVALQLVFMIASQLLIVRFSGAGTITDSYIAAQTIPSVIISIITSVLQSVWLPRLSSTSKDATCWMGEQSKALGQAGIVSLGAVLLVIVTMLHWLDFLFPGFTKAQLQITAYFADLLLLASLFNIQSAILTLSLRTKGLFISAEMINLSGVVISLIAIFYALPIWGLVSAAWITVIRSVFVYIFQLKLAKWPCMSFSEGWKLKETWTLMRPLFMGTSIYKFSPLVDRHFASQAPTGSITVFSLAQLAVGALATVIERSICVTITPSFSKYIKNSDYEGLKAIYKKSLWQIAGAVFALGVILILTKPIFLVITSKLLNLEAYFLEKIWVLIILFLGYLYSVASGSILVAVFYALNDTKTPVYIGVIGFSFSLILKFFAFSYFGLYGLVAASSVYLTLNVCFYFVSLEKKLARLKGSF